jgi:hypothetical protein
MTKVRSAAIIDLKAPRLTCFQTGFWKGLAAPMLFYSSFELPPEAIPKRFVELDYKSSGDLASDWRRVGEAIQAASLAVRAEGG